MSLGFDVKNLAAAVKKVMEFAITRSPNNRIIEDEKEIDTTDEAQVTDYLMTQAQKIYDQEGPLVEGQIRGNVYWSVGVVYEANQGEMHPPPISRAPERPTHLAMFWQTL